MKQYQFSVIIPAHNEENYIYKCLKSVRTAAKQVDTEKVEIIVVANRCTDKTVEIARYYGAKVIVNDSKCISSIRNTGIRAAQGNIIVTIDADSMMTKYSLVEIRQMLQSGNYIGGGTQPRFDRMSFGIFCSSMYVALNLLPVMMKNKAFLSGGMFWFYRKDFETIGGFNETLVSLEDMDFTVRLHQLGISRNQKYGTLKHSTHEHFDHFSLEDIRKVRKADTVFIAPKSMEKQMQNIGCSSLILPEPDETAVIRNIPVKTIPAYNLLKPFHPKKNGWLGYLITLNGQKIYVSGDMDATKEAKSVSCDIALIPIGGTYTMNFKEAAEYINIIKPEIVIPTHYGTIVGKSSDGESFKKLVSPSIQVILKL